MARWEGNTRGRLEQAALELFQEQGYDGTTVAQIAQRASLTERSFYRWFADKREVLFAGDDLEDRYLTAMKDVPEGTAALPTLLAAFAPTPEVLRPLPFLTERSRVIAAHPQLQERELMKLVVLSEALCSALIGRGHEEQTARLATDVGMAVLRLATRRWLTQEPAERPGFPELLTASAAELLAVTAEAVPLSRRSQ